MYIITIYNIVQQKYTVLVCVLFVCIILDVIQQTAVNTTLCDTHEHHAYDSRLNTQSSRKTLLCLMHKGQINFRDLIISYDPKYLYLLLCIIT